MDVATASLTSTGLVSKPVLGSEESAKADQCQHSKPIEEILPAEECLEKFNDDDLQEEVQDLIDDQEYNEFVVAIAKEAPLDKATLDDKEDDEFLPKFVSAKKLHLDENVKEESENSDEDVSSDESTSSESDTSGPVAIEGENSVVKSDEEDLDVSPEEVNQLKENIPVAIPKDSLTKTQGRYPAFWRVKHAIRNIGENDGYKSDDDGDFQPPKESEEMDNSTCENDQPDNRREQSTIDLTDSTSEDSSADEDDSDMENEVKVLEEMPDLTHDIKGLSEMVQDMSVVKSQPNLPTENQSFNEAMEEENADASFSPINFAEAILQHDDADYDESADPDYDPSLEAKKDDNKSDSDCDTSATSDSTDESDSSSSADESAMVQG